jgi:hypothetical protein
VNLISLSPASVTSGIAGQDRAHGLLEGDRTASGPALQWQVRGYFPPALTAPLHREAK